METRFHKKLGPILHIGAIPLLLVCAIVIVALMMRSAPVAMGGETNAGQGQSSSSASVSDAAYDNNESGAQPVTTMGRCATCGVIESIREIQDSGAAKNSRIEPPSNRSGTERELAGKMAVVDTNAGHQSQNGPTSTKRYEVTVRMKNGSTRVLSELDIHSWRVGRKVILIDGSGDV